MFKKNMSAGGGSAFGGKKIFLLIIFSFFLCLPALAHQPYLVEQGTGLTQVQDPEVSKAYYGILTGQPEYYEIKSPVAFQLYLNILIPAVSETNRNMLVEVFQDNEQGPKLFTLNGTDFNWTPFFEEFARDNYFAGPELREKVSAGTYLIKVSLPAGRQGRQGSSDNQGRYSLAVGEKEEFPPAEIVRSLQTLPQIKSQIFNKPSWQGFANIFGLFIIVPVVIVLVIIIVVVWFVRKRNKNPIT